MFETNEDVYSTAKSRNFTDVHVVGQFLCPNHTNVCKISRLYGVVSSFALDIR